MKRTAASLIALHLAAGMAVAQPALDAGFRSPPASAKPHTWWHWMNGNVSKPGITADLEAMKAAGLGGAQIFNPSEGIPEGPVKYNSPEWRGLVKFAAEEADRLGIELCFHNCAGWSSSGGPWVTPENAMQKVVVSEVKVKGGAAGTAALPQPATVAGYYRDIAVLAFPSAKEESFRIPNIGNKAMYGYEYGIRPSEEPIPAGAAIGKGSIVDLTGKMAADGKLAWGEKDLGAGEWTIVRFGSTPTGAVNAPSPASGRGLEVDKLSSEAFDAFWAGGPGLLLKDLGPLAGKSLNNCLVDSYEVGSQNWTPKMREEFRARRGYDPLPYLLVMTGRAVGDGLESERFLWDLRRTVGDLFADKYYSRFAARCKEAGLLSSTEPYDGPFECTQVARDADIVMGEFWTNGGMSSSCKLAASVAHVYGKTIVGAESYTAFPEVGKWMNTPANLKAVGDLMFTAGVNRDIIHRYAHQPWADVSPGMTMGQWGTHLERTTTWWPQAHAWFEYLARCQYMLQQGRFVADALIFAGDEAPNTPPFREDLKAAGWDYDACGGDILMQAVVKGGRLTLPSGMSYRVLALPDSRFMRPETAAKVRELVEAGATVVGSRPVKSPSLAGQPKADADVAAAAAAVWGDCDGVKVKSRAAGKGQIRCGEDLKETLATVVEGGADFLAAPAASGEKPSTAGGIAWIHRTTSAGEVYFLSNQKPRSVSMTCSFRAEGAPEFWRPEDGRTEPAAVWSVESGRTVVPVRLGPSGSVFVVLRQGAGGEHFASMKAPVDEREAKLPKVVVTKAMYEAVDGAGSADVTGKVRDMIAAGEYGVAATNGNFGDPSYMHVKRLRVEYTVDGAAKTVAIPENGVAHLVDIVIPDRPSAFEWSGAGGDRRLVAFRPGRYEFTDARGGPVAVVAPAAPKAVEVRGPWSVTFEPGRGAPPSAMLPALASLSKSEVPGIRYFSGAAVYTAEFEAAAIGPDLAARLDLGAVRDLAEVSLNGHDLGVWWRPPFSADVTAHLKPGKNTLTVKVTNTWVNRLIGDEQYADDCEWNGITIKAWPKWFDPASPHPLAARPSKERLTFTTWKHWHKDSPLPDSGLLGPVTVEFGARIKVEGSGAKPPSR